MERLLVHDTALASYLRYHTTVSIQSIKTAQISSVKASLESTKTDNLSLPSRVDGLDFLISPLRRYASGKLYPSYNLLERYWRRDFKLTPQIHIPKCICVLWAPVQMMGYCEGILFLTPSI